MRVGSGGGTGVYLLSRWVETGAEFLGPFRPQARKARVAPPGHSSHLSHGVLDPVFYEQLVVVRVARDVRVLPPLLQHEQRILRTARAQNGAAVVETRLHEPGRQPRHTAVEDELDHRSHKMTR